MPQYSSHQLLQWLSHILIWSFRIMIIFWLMGFALFVQYVKYQKLPPPIQTDGIVIFTGGKNRSRTGIALYTQGYGRYVHISGTGMKMKHKNFSYDNALNTIENVQYTHKWIQKSGLSSVRLVTSDYHMPRCLLHAKRLWTAKIIEHPLRCPFNFPCMFREYNKWLWTWWDYLIQDLGLK